MLRAHAVACFLATPYLALSIEHRLVTVAEPTHIAQTREHAAATATQTWSLTPSPFATFSSPPSAFSSGAYDTGARALQVKQTQACGQSASQPASHECEQASLPDCMSRCRPCDQRIQLSQPLQLFLDVYITQDLDVPMCADPSFLTQTIIYLH